MALFTSNAEMVAASAIERKESRGAHYRLDFPARNDDEWMHHVTCTYAEAGPQLGTLPVTITQWEPQERTY